MSGATHNGSGTALYRAYYNMRGRCNNPTSKDYHKYGGRGITVCDEWNDFEVFRVWALKNGYAPRLHLHRKDNDKGYSPENCEYLAPSVHMAIHNKLRAKAA